MRLLIVGEGATEVRFANEVLRPHLDKISRYGMQITAPNLRGHRTYAETKRFLRTLLGSDAGVRVTTMIDLFKLPADFPARSDRSANPDTRVANISSAFARDIDDARFIPYLQLHEFEALLLTDITVLSVRHPNRRNDLERLAQEVARFPNPEHVNNMRPPSYRILDAVPEYNKVNDGPIAVADLSLDRLRTSCPHFGSWLGTLESLARESTVRSTE